mgnify:CR=1 FL=1
MSIDQLRDVKLITALITPFHEDGSINYDALPDLIEHLLAHHTELFFWQEQLLKAQRLLMMRSWNSLRLFKRLSMVVCH